MNPQNSFGFSNKICNFARLKTEAIITCKYLYRYDVLYDC